MVILLSRSGFRNYDGRDTSTSAILRLCEARLGKWYVGWVVFHFGNQTMGLKLAETGDFFEELGGGRVLR
jgi:hypothetical protein